MTYAEALTLANRALDSLHARGVQGRASDIIAILRALGVLQIEDQEPRLAIPVNARGVDTVYVDLSVVTAALAEAGYTVTKKPVPESDQEYREHEAAAEGLKNAGGV